MKMFSVLLVGFLALGSVSGFAAQESSTATEVDGELYFDCSEEMASELPVEPRNWVRSTTTGRLLIPAVALIGMCNLPVADGGPLMAVACGVGCKIICGGGCISIGALLAPLMSPPAAAMIALSCGALAEAGSIPACVTTCLALPTP